MPFEVSTMKSKNVTFGCNIRGFVALLEQKPWEFAHKKLLFEILLNSLQTALETVL